MRSVLNGLITHSMWALSKASPTDPIDGLPPYEHLVTAAMSDHGSPSLLSGPASAARRSGRRWIAYAAASWAALFCLQSLVAAIVAMAGSDFGADAFAAHFAKLARERDTGFILVLWIAVLAKAAGVAVGLAWLRPSAGPGKGALSAVTMVSGLALLGYGLVDLLESVLMSAGVLAVPSSLGERALAWHEWLWNPYWIIGGLLFLALRTRRATEDAR